MRLAFIPPIFAVLALAACDSNGALITAKASAPAAAPAARCAPALPACAPAATPTPTTPPVMAPEPAVHRPAPRKAPRHVKHQRHEPGYTRVGHQEYARAPASEYEGYVYVPHGGGSNAGYQAETVYEEAYSEGSAGHGGYEVHRGCGGGCAPREAAGRDRNGYLTWPGKVPANP